MGPRVVETQSGGRVVASVLFLAGFLASPIAVMATMANPPLKEELAAADVTVSQGPALASPGLTESGDIGSFTFGYVEFDVDPRRPNGVPGFDSSPPGPRRR